jgi:hypothetical protein
VLHGAPRSAFVWMETPPVPGRTIIDPPPRPPAGHCRLAGRPGHTPVPHHDDRSTHVSQRVSCAAHGWHHGPRTNATAYDAVSNHEAPVGALLQDMIIQSEYGVTPLFRPHSHFILRRHYACISS